MPKTTIVRDRETAVSANRPKRVPLHEQRDQLTTEKKDGFVRRWVNDIPGRVEKFLNAGYSVVQDANVKVGTDGVDTNNIALGTGARKDVGRTRSSENTQAVLMEIPVELYEADQKAKQSKVDETDAVLKRNVRDHDFYGDIKQSSSYARKKQS